MELTQAEPGPGQSPRKRQGRWLIVAFVLVLVSMGTWWYWPRGDARFVGRWIDSRDLEGVFDFRPTGVVYWSNREGGRATSWTHWRVDGDILRLGQNPNQADRSPFPSVYAAWGKVTGQQWVAHGWYGPHRITGVTANSVSFVEFDEQTGQSLSEFTFTRLPE